MRVVTASDHAGYKLKTLLIRLVEQLGHTVSDLGNALRCADGLSRLLAAVGRAVRTDRPAHPGPWKQRRGERRGIRDPEDYWQFDDC